MCVCVCARERGEREKERAGKTDRQMDTGVRITGFLFSFLNQT